MIIGREKLRELIEKEGLIRNYIDIEKQLTENGFDLTVEHIFRFKGKGQVDFSNKERILPETEEISPEKGDGEEFGWWNLEKGIYKFRTNEIIKLPLNLVAIAFPRTTLLRSGVSTLNGVWDSGFEGKSEGLLMVENEYGIRIKENARIIQIIFMESTGSSKDYRGIYKNLGVINSMPR